MFALEAHELGSRSLVFYLYATDKHTNTLIGEVELKLGDMDLSQPSVTWLVLTDTGQVEILTKLFLLFNSCHRMTHVPQEIAVFIHSGLYVPPSPSPYSQEALYFYYSRQ